MSLFALIIVIMLSALIIKVGTIALRMTGIDKATASFQSLSAFTGTGFTTSEAENIVNNNQRKRVIKALMVLGNVGIVSAVTMLILSFRGGTFMESLTKIGILGLAAGALIFFSLLKGLENVLDSFIEKRLSKMTHFSLGTFHEIIRLASGYGIAEVSISADHPLASKKLYESELSSSNILVLAVKRGFHLIAAPKAEERIEPGDKLVCFGLLKNLAKVAVETAKDPAAR
jgi:hypothetical protein